MSGHERTEHDDRNEAGEWLTDYDLDVVERRATEVLHGEREADGADAAWLAAATEALLSETRARRDADALAGASDEAAVERAARAATAEWFGDPEAWDHLLGLDRPGWLKTVRVALSAASAARTPGQARDLDEVNQATADVRIVAEQARHYADLDVRPAPSDVRAVLTLTRRDAGWRFTPPTRQDQS